MIKPIVIALAFIATTLHAAGPSVPVVTNNVATNILSDGVTASGIVVSDGNAECQAFLFLANYDGGTNAWYNHDRYDFGVVTNGQVCSTNVTGLESSTAYYYTFKATNSAGTAWAMPSISFTTPTMLQGIQDIGGQVTNAYIVSTNSGDISFVMGSDVSQNNPVYSTNSAWYYYKTNCLLWYPFCETNDVLIKDWSSNLHTGMVMSAVNNPTPNCFSGDCYRISSIYENAIRTIESGVGSNSTDLTVALWIYPMNTVTALFSPFGSTSSKERSYFDISTNTSFVALYWSSMWSGWFNNPLSSASLSSGLYYTLSPLAWHRVIFHYSKNGPTFTSTALLWLYIDKTLIYSGSSALNFFPATGYWVIGPPVAATTSWQDFLIDDFVVDAHNWSYSMITNDYAIGRSRTLILP